MSKPVKQMIVQEYRERFAGVDDAMLISIRGLDANANNQLRLGLAEKQIRVTVVRNALAKSAFRDTALEALGQVLTGPNALVYGAESVVEVARAVVDVLPRFPGIELNGAVLDGQLFAGDEGVKALSRFPTRDEAIAKDVTLILSPGRKLVGQALGPGSRLAGIIRTVREKLEAGEQIAKAG